MRNRKQSGYKLDNVRVRWIKLPFRETFSEHFSLKKGKQIIYASFLGADYQMTMFFRIQILRPLDETHVEHWKNSFWASSAFFKGLLMTNYLISHIFCISFRFLGKRKKKSFVNIVESFIRYASLKTVFAIPFGSNPLSNCKYYTCIESTQTHWDICCEWMLDFANGFHLSFWLLSSKQQVDIIFN